jgi:hypothetical protein
MGGGLKSGGFAYGYQLYQGQRFASPTNDAWNPIAVGPVRSTVPAPIPTVAPMNSGPGLTRTDTGGSKGGASVVGVPVAVIVALAASLLLLRYVHFRG